MAEAKVLPGEFVRGNWQFRAGEISNWIEANLQTLPDRRRRDRHPVERADLLITNILAERSVSVDVLAKTKSSVLRELAVRAAEADEFVDMHALVETLQEREATGSTALQDGIAVPHPARPIYTNGSLIVALRTSQGVFFGQRDGGASDLFFLVCCPTHAEHLLVLGRLCRLLIDPALQTALRDAQSPREFHTALCAAERALCKD
jgi:mannitol/fructose-specific phosphotransferase system IIA component (Ntr-type)